MPIAKQPFFILGVLICCLSTKFIIAQNKTFYILHYGSHNRKPFMFLGPGQTKFIKFKCKHTNCHVTSNKKYFKTMAMFDAVVFDAVDLVKLPNRKYLPPNNERTAKQKYVFTSVESDVNYPLCRPFLDNYFNWTFTYRLDSDFRRGYITVYDLKDKTVGPMVNMKWPRDLKPIDEKFKKKLQYKTELAAWFVSNCKSKGDRRHFVNIVQDVLKRNGGMSVDIFGRCGKYHCAHRNSRCSRLLKRDYFFYFAFENSLSKDYVTEKLLIALDNYNVPVVYGAANYSRFLPPGSYLNARELGPEKLALRMLEIQRNASAFHDFFRWRNYFKYKETTYNDDSCHICDMLNNDEKLKRHTTVKDFVKWWNNGRCRSGSYI